MYNDQGGRVFIPLKSLWSLEGVVASTSSSSPTSKLGTWGGVVPGGSLGGVHVGLLLGLADVPLVADPLVPEPVAHLNKKSQSSVPSYQSSPVGPRFRTSEITPPSPPPRGRGWRGWRRNIHLKFLETFY